MLTVTELVEELGKLVNQKGTKKKIVGRMKISDLRASAGISKARLLPRRNAWKHFKGDLSAVVSFLQKQGIKLPTDVQEAVTHYSNLRERPSA